jgi:DNA-binding response OmpR family regulator
MRILLVDDDRDTLELLTEYLRLHGHEVHPVSSAGEALLKTVEAYDALILDIMLPDLDGYSLAREIRRAYAFKVNPRFIALSGRAFSPEHPHAAQAAFDVFLLKPIELKRLTDALNGSVVNPQGSP